MWQNIITANGTVINVDSIMLKKAKALGLTTTTKGWDFMQFKNSYVDKAGKRTILENNKERIFEALIKL